MAAGSAASQPAASLSVTERISPPGAESLFAAPLSRIFPAVRHDDWLWPSCERDLSCGYAGKPGSIGVMSGGFLFRGLPEMYFTRRIFSNSLTLATKGRKLATISPRLSFITLRSLLACSPAAVTPLEASQPISMPSMPAPPNSLEMSPGSTAITVFRGDAVWNGCCRRHYSGFQKSLPAFSLPAKIYFSPYLQAQTLVRDNLSRKIRDKGESRKRT